MSLGGVWAAGLRRLTLPLRWAGHAVGLAGIRRAEGIVVGLGGVLRPGRLVHGGAVKLLELGKAFRVDEEEFSVLYLVSSAPPEFAESLVEVCRRRGIRVVWNQNGVAYPAWAGRRMEAINGPMRRLRAAADFVVYQSAFCRRSAGRWLGECDIPSAVLFNPVDLDFFRPPKEPVPWPPFRLLAMGTHHYPERVLSAVEMLAELRRRGVEARLTVAGALLWRNARGQVLAAARRLGVADFLGLEPPFDREGALRLCQSHHVLVHPKPMDPCPTVVAEALACGLPVAGSATGGLPEMTRPDCARLVPGEEDWEKLRTPSGSELADAVAGLLGDLPGASKAAREAAQELFDARRWINEHRRVFERVLGMVGEPHPA